MNYVHHVSLADRWLAGTQDEPGVCGSECKTVQLAAVDVIGDRDTDLGELLWKVRIELQPHDLNTLQSPMMPALVHSPQQAAVVGQKRAQRLCRCTRAADSHARWCW